MAGEAVGPHTRQGSWTAAPREPKHARATVGLHNLRADRQAWATDGGVGFAAADERPPGAGVALSFKVSDFDRHDRRLREAGASPIGEAIDSEHERRQAFADPFGNAFYICEPRG